MRAEEKIDRADGEHGERADEHDAHGVALRGNRSLARIGFIDFGMFGIDGIFGLGTTLGRHVAEGAVAVHIIIDARAEIEFAVVHDFRGKRGERIVGKKGAVHRICNGDLVFQKGRDGRVVHGNDFRLFAIALDRLVVGTVGEIGNVIKLRRLAEDLHEISAGQGEQPVRFVGRAVQIDSLRLDARVTFGIVRICSPCGGERYEQHRQ